MQRHTWQFVFFDRDGKQIGWAEVEADSVQDALTRHRELHGWDSEIAGFDLRRADPPL